VSCAAPLFGPLARLHLAGSMSGWRRRVYHPKGVASRELGQRVSLDFLLFLRRLKENQSEPLADLPRNGIIGLNAQELADDSGTGGNGHFVHDEANEGLHRIGADVHAGGYFLAGESIDQKVDGLLLTVGEPESCDGSGDASGSLFAAFQEQGSDSEGSVARIAQKRKEAA
jgi:hypothetical protein